MSAVPSLSPEPLVALVTTDYSGTTRGRSLAVATYERTAVPHVGWVPANQSLTPFDSIAADGPWGSAGDLRLLADKAARYTARLPGAATPLDLVMSDVVELDGTPWCACPRSQLKQVIAELAADTGLAVVGAFEHEFQLKGDPFAEAPAFSLRALRRADPFGPVVVAALAAAGLAPEMFIAEYGRNQFEVPVGPKRGVTIADDAVAVREVVREAARLAGHAATFAPKTAPEGVGNGVHIHLSLVDADGRNVLHQPGAPGSLSATGGAFAAGIVRHLPALVAVTAPSAVSYLRLQPHHWSSSYTWLGDQDREASVRICRGASLGGQDPGRGFNLEYRAADATASPHLALAAVLRAGLQGLRESLPAPPVHAGDPDALSAAERARLGLRRLPTTLAEALALLEGDAVVASTFTPKALATYLGMKRHELTAASGDSDADLCRRYAAVY